MVFFIFLLLSTLLFPICVLTSWNNINENKNYFLAFLILEFFNRGV